MEDAQRRGGRIIFQSRRNERVYAHYILACDDRAMPRREDIDPERLKNELPYVYMTKVEPEVPSVRFRIRLMGTHLVDVLKQEGTGHLVGDLAMGGFENEWRRTLLTAYRVRKPVISIDTVVLTRGIRLEFEHVALPLSENGNDVDRLFGSFDFPGYSDRVLGDLIRGFDWTEVSQIEVSEARGHRASRGSARLTDGLLFSRAWRAASTFCPPLRSRFRSLQFIGNWRLTTAGRAWRGLCALSAGRIGIETFQVS